MANYKDSPFGTAKHIHVNKPDSKFNPDKPEFKVDLILEGEAALLLKADVDAQAEEAFENFKQTDKYENMKPKDKRELSVYYPYEEEEDDDGNKTGRIIFNFKQNAQIKLKDGSTKEISIGIYDASGTKEIKKLVRAGSEVRVRYSYRAIPMPQLKQVGVRLDFMAIQVKVLAQGGGSAGFGAVDGYRDDGQSGGFDNANEDNSPASSGDDADY